MSHRSPPGLAHIRGQQVNPLVRPNLMPSNINKDLPATVRIGRGIATAPVASTAS